jgi:hypothetical protein
MPACEELRRKRRSLQALKRELDGVSPGLDLAGMQSASIGTSAAANGANGNGALPGGCGSMPYSSWP